LEIMDKIQPGCVDWSKVNKDKNKLNNFRIVENCNQAIEAGKKLKLSLVGIGGSDIVNGVETLVLGLVWQVMRLQVMTLLRSLSLSGKEITEAEIVSWATNEVRAAGKDTKMEGFKDPTLGNGRFLIDLLSAINERIVNYDLVTEGETPEDKLQNAKYAISIARKLGATIFVLPEDIVEVKPKMMLTFFGSVMAVALGTAEERKGKLLKMKAEQEDKEKADRTRHERIAKIREEERKRELSDIPKGAVGKSALKAKQEEDEDYEYVDEDEEGEGEGEGEGEKGEAAGEYEYEYEGEEE